MYLNIESVVCLCDVKECVYHGRDRVCLRTDLGESGYVSVSVSSNVGPSVSVALLESVLLGYGSASVSVWLPLLPRAISCWRERWRRESQTRGNNDKVLVTAEPG